MAVALATLGSAAGGGCGQRGGHQRPGPPDGAAGAGGTSAISGERARHLPKPVRPTLPPLGPDEVYVYGAGADTTATKKTVSEARSAGLLVVDLSDDWAPYIFQDGSQDERPPLGQAAAAPGIAAAPTAGQGGATGGSDEPESAAEEANEGTNADGPKPNGYRKTFVDLANDRVDADGRKLPKGEHNY